MEEKMNAIVANEDRTVVAFGQHLMKVNFKVVWNEVGLMLPIYFGAFPTKEKAHEWFDDFDRLMYQYWGLSDNIKILIIDNTEISAPQTKGDASVFRCAAAHTLSYEFITGILNFLEHARSEIVTQMSKQAGFYPEGAS